MIKDIVIIACVFVGLAIIVEIVYLIGRIIIDKMYWNRIEHDVHIIHVYGPKEHVKPECTIHVEGEFRHNDPFDLGVEVDKVRFGDEE